MIFSMTGYGRATVSGGGFTIDCEVKSFNNKFLDVSLRLPQLIQSREYDIREIIRARVRRGKVYLTMQMKAIDSTVPGFTPDPASVDALIAGLKKIKKEHKIKDKISLSHLVVFKDLFTSQSVELSDEAFDAVKVSVNSALDNLFEMRRAEGEQLSADIASRLNLIEQFTSEVGALTKNGAKEQFEKLKVRAKELVENITQYSERLELELALLADRSDITEECVRIKSHIKYMRESLNSAEESGKRLNFLCQELNREANTISSKSVSAEVTFIAVKIKEEIERIREQVQNLE